jgi:hypothetical protein
MGLLLLLCRFSKRGRKRRKCTPEGGIVCFTLKEGVALPASLKYLWKLLPTNDHLFCCFDNLIAQDDNTRYRKRRKLLWLQAPC